MKFLFGAAKNFVNEFGLSERFAACDGEAPCDAQKARVLRNFRHHIIGGGAFSRMEFPSVRVMAVKAAEGAPGEEQSETNAGAIRSGTSFHRMDVTCLHETNIKNRLLWNRRKSVNVPIVVAFETFRILLEKKLVSNVFLVWIESV